MKKSPHTSTILTVLLAVCILASGLGTVAIVNGQNLSIDKDIILSPGRVIKFPDNSTLNSASAIGGGGWTVSSTKIYPTAGGFVGIGTTNPTTPLYVVGTTTITGALTVGGSGGISDSASSTAIYRTMFYDSDNVAYFLNPAATAISATFAGNVGVGTVSPDAKIMVTDNGGSVRIGNTCSAGYGGISFNGQAFSGCTNYNLLSSPSDPDLYINRPTGRAVHIRENNADQMVVLSGGNVGIGTATPAQKLSVAGAISIGDGYSIAGDGTSGFFVGNSNDLYLRANGSTNVFISKATGNVGVGTATPGSYKLNVAGTIYANEGTSAADIIADKIDGATFDPVYTIEGKRYATYNPGMVGVKEELSGVLNLTANSGVYSGELNFQNLSKGSDLWLFMKASNLEHEGLQNVSVLLTPNFDGSVWYTKDTQNNKIVVHAKMNSGSADSVEVSYRLTAPRFDHKDWTNFSTSDWEGLNVDEFLKNNK